MRVHVSPSLASNLGEKIRPFSFLSLHLRSEHRAGNDGTHGIRQHRAWNLGDFPSHHRDLEEPTSLSTG